MGWSMDWVHGPGPWGGPWTRSIGWSMDPGPCFVYVPNDVRAVTRNINFPVVDIFHSRLPLRIAVASPRYTTTFNINTFSKNTKTYNLLMAEEHVPYS